MKTKTLVNEKVVMPLTKNKTKTKKCEKPKIKSNEIVKTKMKKY